MVTPPRIRNGRRGPAGDRCWSLIRPAIGFSNTSQNLGAKTITLAHRAAMPRLSVRNGNSIRPGTVPNAPVATDPDPYPRRTRVERGALTAAAVAGGGTGMPGL